MTPDLSITIVEIILIRVVCPILVGLVIVLELKCTDISRRVKHLEDKEANDA